MVTREELERVLKCTRENMDENVLHSIYAGDRWGSAKPYYKYDNQRLLDLLDAAGRCAREDALAEVDDRLMPEGMAWPRYADGTKVSWEENRCFDDGRYLDACDVVLALDGSCYALTDYGGDMLEAGERLERASQDSLVERLRAIAARTEGEGK